MSSAALWTAALRHFLRQPLSKRTVHSCCTTFESVADAQISGAHGSSTSAVVDTIQVLRALRWEALRCGTPSAKTIVLHSILRTYANAAAAAHPVSLKERDALVDDANCEERVYLMEAVISLAEAKLTGVPLDSMCFEIIAGCPALCRAGPDIPLVLLREMEGQGIPSEEVALACAVGYARSGNWETALSLTPTGFLSQVVRRLVQGDPTGSTALASSNSSRGAWEEACRLVGAIPTKHIVEGTSHCGTGGENSTQSEASDGIQAVCTAMAAACAANRADAATQDIFPSLVRLTEKWSGHHGNRPVPRQCVEACLSCCPATDWEAATSLFVAHNTRAWEAMETKVGRPEESSTAVPPPPAAAQDERVPVGRLLSVLSLAHQWETVLRIHASTAVSDDSAHIFSLGSDHVSSVNHTFAALSEGLRHSTVSVENESQPPWHQALHFFASAQNSHNEYSHLTFLRQALHPRSPYPFTTIWSQCLQSYDAVVRSHIGDREGFGELLTLAFAVGGRTDFAESVALRCNENSRYAPLMALSACIEENDADRARRLLRCVLESQRLSAKQLAFAVAAQAVATSAGTPTGQQLATDVADYIHSACERSPEAEHAAYLPIRTQEGLDAFMLQTLEYLHSAERVPRTSDAQQVPESVEMDKTKLLEQMVRLLRRARLNASGGPSTALNSGPRPGATWVVAVKTFSLIATKKSWDTSSVSPALLSTFGPEAAMACLHL